MVKSLPKNVQDLFNDREAVKVLATHSDSTMHVVPLGMMAPMPDMIAYGRGFLNIETHENLLNAKKNGGLASVLAVKGRIAYQVRVKPMEYQTSGPLFDKIKEIWKPLAEQMKMNINDLLIGIWTLQPIEIINQGMEEGGMGKKL